MSAPLSFLSFLAKLAPYYDRLDDLLEAIGALASAQGMVNKWSALKSLGDILVPILANVTGLAFDDEAKAVAHFEAQRLGDGRLIEKLKQLYPLIERYLPLLLDLLT